MSHRSCAVRASRVLRSAAAASVTSVWGSRGGAREACAQCGYRGMHTRAALFESVRTHAACGVACTAAPYAAQHQHETHLAAQSHIHMAGTQTLLCSWLAQ